MVEDRANLHGVVQSSQRKGPITMGLLWITMMTLFPCTLVGFLWYKDGMNFSQVLSCTFLSCLMMMAYGLPACHLGAKTGRSYGSIIKAVFGEKGANVVTFNLVWMFVIWYGLISLFLGESLYGLFKFDIPMIVVAPALALVMALNNFWGFKGVANFARYFAAPLLILWVIFSFCKAAGNASPAVYTDPARIDLGAAFILVANFVIGCGVWGNEQDYWRYSKNSIACIFPPILTAALVGLCLFPVTGWMVAKSSGITDYAQATAYMSDYSFGGVPWLCALVLVASYFAVNDSNLFGSSSSLSHLFKLPHRPAVILLALLGACLAAFLSHMGCAKSLEHIASLNCVIMATPTIILITEFYILGPLSKHTTINVDAALEGKTKYRPAALIALLAGCIVGVSTAGVIPGMESLKIGICWLQGWAVAILTYMSLRISWKTSYASVTSDSAPDTVLNSQSEIEEVPLPVVK